jgi:hypothetical protein
VSECGLDSSGLRYKKLHTVVITIMKFRVKKKRIECLDQLSDYRLMEKDSAKQICWLVLCVRVKECF